ncbi:MAG: class I SAM-dependent methyltransferase [Oscillospiraceae bacterium]|nr:class I SAM-dependent methyltransferase [Oscillospiraceae bacterium]
MKKTVNKENIDRFNGFSGLYNDSRPTPPEIITQSTLLYANKNPQTIVDVGCGTGLSTLIWKDVADSIIGVEPNDDMRSEAEKSIKANNISFMKGLSNEIDLLDECADIVSVSQAFHWFDIDSTLEEIHRILKPGGVLAIFDCDWPPAVNWIVEQAYHKVRNKADDICFSQEKPAVRNDKNSYISRINSFGKFRFSKEMVCHGVEKCTPKRMIGIALSQGGIQDALKFDTSFQKDVDEFCVLVTSNCIGEFDIIFSYRLRLAVK